MSTIEMIGPRLINPSARSDAKIDALLVKFDRAMRAAEEAKSSRAFNDAIAAASLYQKKIRDLRLKNPARKRQTAKQKLMRAKRRKRIIAVGARRLDSAAIMRRRYGTRALSVSHAMKNIAKTAAQQAHWDRVIEELEQMPMRNPARKKRGRSAGGLMRPSQVTRKKPTKRLIRRRKITARSPKGLFANPVRHGYTVIARGAEIATFKTKAHAAQYGQAFADAYKTQVKVKR